MRAAKRERGRKGVGGREGGEGKKVAERGREEPATSRQCTRHLLTWKLSTLTQPVGTVIERPPS